MHSKPKHQQGHGSSRRTGMLNSSESLEVFRAADKATKGNGFTVADLAHEQAELEKRKIAEARAKQREATRQRRAHAIAAREAARATNSPQPTRQATPQPVLVTADGQPLIEADGDGGGGDSGAPIPSGDDDDDDSRRARIKRAVRDYCRRKYGERRARGGPFPIADIIGELRPDLFGGAR